jgi:hypothetical protein
MPAACTRSKLLSYRKHGSCGVKRRLACRTRFLSYTA